MLTASPVLYVGNGRLAFLGNLSNATSTDDCPSYTSTAECSTGAEQASSQREASKTTQARVQRYVMSVHDRRRPAVFIVGKDRFMHRNRQGHDHFEQSNNNVVDDSDGTWQGYLDA